MEETLANEYTYEGKRLKHMLESIGLSIQDLSPEGQSNLNALTKLAMNCNLGEFQTSNYAHALYRLLKEQEKVEDDQRQSTQVTNSIKKMIKQSLLELEDLKKVKENLLEEQNSLNESNNVAEMTQIMREYEQKKSVYQEEIIQMQQILQERQFDPSQPDSVQHHHIVALSKETQKLSQETKALEKELASFYDLPLDPHHRLQEAQQELDNLQRKFEGELQNLQ